MDAIRRYSPPTCTLELKAQTSPLARWTQRPVLKGVTFRLSFDSPQRPSEEHLQVSGNQEQLEAIAASVQTYVQSLLARSAQALSQQLQAAPNLSLPITNASAPGTTPLEWADRTPPRTAVATLRPASRLKHQLQLNLTPRPATIALSTIELLDLADALSAYSQDGVVALPATQAPWVRPAAAAVLVAGLTATLAPLWLSQTRSPEVALDAPTARPEAAVVPPGDGIRPEATPDVAVPSFEDASEPPASPESAAPAPATGPAARPLPPAPPAPGPAASDSVPRPAPTAPPTTAPQPGPSDNATATIPPELQSIPPLEEPAPEQATAQQRRFSAPDPLSRGPAPLSPSQTAQQVQTAIQERWQPPEDLRQSLEYRVTLAQDGTLQRVVPIGDTAQAYLPQVSALQVGEPIIPPTQTSSPPIRLVLRQDGQVRAFLERL